MEKYYWSLSSDGFSIMRQTRYKADLARGKEHPHDVMAIARTEEEKRQMHRIITGEELHV